MEIDKVEIGWSRGAGLMSQMIQRLDYAKKGEPSHWNHVFWKFTFTNGPVLIYESHSKIGVRPTPWDYFMEAYHQNRVQDYCLQEIELDGEVKTMLWRECVTHHGKSYDRRLIMAYLVWARRRGKGMQLPWWLKLGYNKRMTCNELVGTTGRLFVPRLAAWDISWTPEILFQKIMGINSADWAILDRRV